MTQSVTATWLRQNFPRTTSPAAPSRMLRAYAAVFENGGIRPAAWLLDVTHSSVSRFVTELEAWLGTPLIDRIEDRRLVAFTPEGEAVGRATL